MFAITIEKCPECGKKHLSLYVTELEKPIVINNIPHLYVVRCPYTDKVFIPRMPSTKEQ